MHLQNRVWIGWVGINFKRGESKVICSSVSCSFDRLFMCFFCCVVVTHFPLILFCVLFSYGWKPFFVIWIYRLLFPLFLNTHIISGVGFTSYVLRSSRGLTGLRCSRRLTPNIQLLCYLSKGIFNVVELVVANIDLGVM